MTDYTTECPICGKHLFVGMGMNEHVNLCMDEKAKMDEEDEEEDEDDDISKDMNSNCKVAPMSRDQMIECATKLMTLQQGSDPFNNMLRQFGALGFNKSNLTKVLKIEKEQIHKNRNNHNHNRNINVNESVLSPIDEEDVDLGGNNGDGLEIDDDDL